MLSDMLSSRSYLELSQERSQEEVPTSRNKNDHSQLMGELSPEVKDEPERRLRRKKRTPPITPEIPDQAENRDSAPDRPARKRGRPKLETVKDAAAIEVDPERSTCDRSMLTRPTGTSSPDSAGATHLSTQKGGNNPDTEVSR